MKELIGKLPSPLPQSYVPMRDLIMANKNIFKPVFRGKDKGKRYVISGENINKYLATQNIKGNF